MRKEKLIQIAYAFFKVCDNDGNKNVTHKKAERPNSDLPAEMVFHHRHPVIPGKLLASRACFRLAGLNKIQDMFNIDKYYLSNTAYQSLKNVRCQMAL